MKVAVAVAILVPTSFEGWLDAAFTGDVGSRGARAGAAERADFGECSEAEADGGAARHGPGSGRQLCTASLPSPDAEATAGATCQSIEAAGWPGAVGAFYTESRARRGNAPSAPAKRVRGAV